ncbi:hypothetical protein [Sporosarcina obsidiansis]|uniref:hypothetical protein n=1 Tax=Sporosarcina obsidiansis TaxID=2660748 RepID=UPI00129A9D45|nr:hypothetical protein [Sporosarcina obsidiansis]
MKRTILKFFMYFLLFFSLNLLVNAWFKPTLNVLTAFSVAFGTSAGIAWVEYYVTRKLAEK